MTTQAWRELVLAASQPYRAAGTFAWRFARGKLTLDPVFQHIVSQGLIAPQARVLDIGCGQGLLASLLQAAAAQAQAGRWPHQWGAVPLGARLYGIELMARDVQRAQAALGGVSSSAGNADSAAEFVVGNMLQTPLPAADVVVILDVLHYVDVDQQDMLLQRVRHVLPQGGTLLLRVGDAGSAAGFQASQWVDRIVTWLRGHRAAPQFGRTLAQWMHALQALGFEVTPQPMSRGTPFANVLLVAKVAHSESGA
jgi:SAM-dependent methyltransferase